MIRVKTILLALALGLGLLAAGLLWRASLYIGAPEQTQQTGAAGIGGPFTLIDQDGQERTNRNFLGRFALVYFGYTYCPDVCPTTLQEMADALGKLGPKAERVVPLFITIDPARDTPAVLKKYLAAFGPRFVGLTGTPDAIAQAAHAYRVYYAKQQIPGGYALDHSSVLYLIGPDGKFVTFYDGDQKADAIAKDIDRRL
jgi:protein SCO1/2